MADFVSPIIGVIGGFFLGWFSHRLTRSREAEATKQAARTARESRKADFLSFLRGWRIEVVRDSFHVTANHFSSKVRLFEEAVERITNDYGAPFEDLVKRVSSLRNSEVESEDGRTKLLETMDAVRDFVKAN
jgi:hypothetical protein